MVVKKYEIYKTAKKTATENGLFLVDGIIYTKVKRLFDFSLLDGSAINENEIRVLKDNALKYVSASNKSAYYGSELDAFTACDGIADFYMHRIYSKDGKHLYDIFQLAKVNHRSMERKSIYDKFYNVKKLEISDGYRQPMFDYEI